LRLVFNFLLDFCSGLWIIIGMEQVLGVDIPHTVAGAAILRQAGFTMGDIAKAQGVSRRSVYNRLEKLPKDCDLTNKKTVRLAAKAVKTLVQGNLVGKMEEIKGSQVLAAAQMIYDRAQPAKQPESSAGSSYTQININVFK
jgi:predicted transcriptional regulator